MVPVYEFGGLRGDTVPPVTTSDDSLTHPDDSAKLRSDFILAGGQAHMTWGEGQ